VENNYAFVHVV